MKILISSLLVLSSAAFAHSREAAYDASKNLQESLRALENDILETTIREDDDKDRDELMKVFEDTNDIYKKVEKEITSKLKKRKHDSKYDDKYSLETILQEAHALRYKFNKLSQSIDELDSRSYRIQDGFDEAFYDYKALVSALREATDDDGSSSWVCRAQGKKGGMFVGFGPEKYIAERNAINNCKAETKLCEVIACRQGGIDIDVIGL